MSAPTSMQEYEDRYRRNTVISGYGAEVTMSMPCPFCAAADFMTYRVVDTERAISRGATCSSCGRSAKAIVEREGPTTRVHVVQTGGPDQPDWLTPKMRRVG